MKIIAVAGGSGMGKTLFTKMLGERLPKSVVLPMDQYYFDKPDDIPAEKYDFDSPQALDFRLFHKALNELAAGNPVRMPQFDYVPAKR
ncbi:MAG: uridine kinase, partial [SAR324 cluster bacterium]|nr:uridine kinase [SAR324 cluster bacterium]